MSMTIDRCIHRLGNTNLDEVARTIRFAPRLTANGLLVSDTLRPDDLTALRRGIAAVRTHSVPILASEDIDRARTVAENLKMDSIDPSALWYMQLPELFALELNLLDALNSAYGFLYFEQLTDGRLAAHIAGAASSDNFSEELVLLYPNNHGMNGDPGLQLTLVTADQILPISLPASHDHSYAVQTAACLYSVELPAAGEPQETRAEPSSPDPQQTQTAPAPEPDAAAAPPEADAASLSKEEDIAPARSDDCWWLS